MTSKISRQGKLPLSSYTFALALAAVFAGSPFAAQAGDVLSQLDDLAAPILASDGTITHYGVTLYGTVDVGAAYETHGADTSDTWQNGTNYMISPSDNKAMTTMVGNAMSATKLGLKGDMPVIDGLNVVFKLEEGFNPLSGAPSDGLHSLIQQNGALAKAPLLIADTANGDSSVNGSKTAFNRGAWGGISNPIAGQLTFGRQNALLADAVVANDPFGGAGAFSLVGFSSTAQGGGTSEDARFDQSLRYSNKVGPVRVAAMYQLPGVSFRNGGDDAIQGDLGVDYQAITFDAVISQKHDAIKASSLTTSDDALLTSQGCGGCTMSNTVEATVFNTFTYAFFATYKPISTVKTYVGYEAIHLSAPTNLGTTLGAAQAEILQYAGYNFLVHSAGNSGNSYTQSENLQYMWVGGNYKLTPDMTLTAAFYHMIQSDFYAKAADTYGSTSKNSGGQENVVSIAADYQFTKRLDFYTGVAWSQVGGGADSNTGSNTTSGFIYNNDVTVLGGARFNF